MQQQQPPPPQQPPHPMGSVPPSNITTEQIQKYLDENKQLILAILDNQNSGKLAECAQYQAQLQKNLLYLAAIADAQPQVPAVRPQMIPNTGMPQGGAQFMQQAAIFPSKGPPLQQQFTTQQVQELQQQQQLHHRPQMMSPFQGHMGMRPLGAMNGMHAAMHAEASHGRGNNNDMPPGGGPSSMAGTGSTPGSSVDGAGNRQEGSAPEHTPAAAAADSHKNSATEQGSRDAEPPVQSRNPEDAKTP